MQLQEFLSKTQGARYIPGQEYLINRLVNKLSGLNNVALVAHKGWGKTMLTKEVGFRLIAEKENIHVFYYDMKWNFDWPSFIRTYILELYKSLSLGMPDLRKTGEPGYKMLDIPECIARKKRIKLIVFISNFEYIGRFCTAYQELKKIRMIWKRQQKCAYCLSGSNQPFFEKQFIKAGNPMGSLARVFFLKRNQSLNFTSYVKSLFFQNEKLIEHKAAVQLVQLVDNHLFYIQRLSWHAFMNTSYLCNSSIVTLAFKDLLSESQIYLQNQLSCLTPKQYYYLQALTSGTDKMCSRENLLKYQLDRSSNVARIKENLLQKEVIEVRRKDVIIIDPLLKHWIDSPLQFKSRT